MKRFVGQLGLLIGLLCCQAMAQSPTAAATLWIRGRVLDEAGAPIPNAGVAIGDAERVTTDDALDRPVARSDAHGWFEVATQHSEQRRRLCIAAEHRVAMFVKLPGSWQAPGDTPAARCELGDLFLPPGATLVGRVRGADGAALPGATVVATDLLADERSDRRYANACTTDGDGRFRLRGVFADALALRVRGPGHLDLHLPWVGAGSPLDLQLDASGFVSGTVHAKANAPEPARVTLMRDYPLDDDEQSPVVDGRFEMQLRQPGRYRLWVSSPDGQYFAQSEVLDGPADKVDITAEEAGSVMTLRAIDAVTGEAIAPFVAARGWVRWPLPAAEPKLVDLAFPSSKSGEWRQRVDEDVDQVMLLATADGYATTIEPEATLRDGQHVVPLLPGASIAGVVETVDGAPLAGVEVRCAWRAPNGDAPLPQGCTTLLGAVRAWTNARGEFVFERLAPGRHALLATGTDGTVLASTTVDVTTGAAARGTRLRLEHGTTVTCSLRGATPGPGWRIEARPSEDAAADGFDDKTVTATIVDGRALLRHLRPGRHQLTLVVPAPPRTGADLRSRLDDIVVTAGADPSQRVDVDLREHRPGQLQGALELTGANVPPGRVGVVAFDIADGPEVELGARWCLLAPDHHFSIACTPGKKLLRVIDVATGVELLDERRVEVQAGGTTPLELRGALGTLRVQCESASAGERAIGRLLILSARQQRFGWNCGWNPGLDCAGSIPDLPLFARAGTVEFALQRASTTIDLLEIDEVPDEVEGPSVKLTEAEQRTVTFQLPTSATPHK